MLTYHNFTVAVPPLGLSVQGNSRWIPLMRKMMIRKFFIVKVYSQQAKAGAKEKKIREQAKVIKD